MYCKNSNSYKQNEIPKTQKATMAVLSPEEENDFLVRKVSLESGGSMPNHTNEIQHQQFVLSGEAKVAVGDDIYHAKAGDFLYIPAGIAHYYDACYGVGYEFLCMITTKEDNIKLCG
ncbi:MAG TPA: cupin domain-containing protein [Sulfurovum sp.]|nr:cupin domain-containing protein [Sulfurovum sp.]